MVLTTYKMNVRNEMCDNEQCSNSEVQRKTTKQEQSKHGLLKK